MLRQISHLLGNAHVRERLNIWESYLKIKSKVGFLKGRFFMYTYIFTQYQVFSQTDYLKHCNYPAILPQLILSEWQALVMLHRC